MKNRFRGKYPQHDIRWCLGAEQMRNWRCHLSHSHLYLDPHLLLYCGVHLVSGRLALHRPCQGPFLYREIIDVSNPCKHLLPNDFHSAKYILKVYRLWGVVCVSDHKICRDCCFDVWKKSKGPQPETAQSPRDQLRHTTASLKKTTWRFSDDISQESVR